MRTRISISSVIAASAVSLLVLTISACGGGGDAGMTATPPAPPMPPSPQPALAANWVPTMDQPLSRSVDLVMWATYGASVLTRADFFIDGQLVGSSTAGEKQPGVPIFGYRYFWNTGNYSDGPHVVSARINDDKNQTADTPPEVVFVENNVTIPLALTPDEVFPTPVSNASASGQLSINLASGAISGDITVTNMTAVSAHIHDAYATSSGDIVVSLLQDGSTNRWVVPAGTVLTTSGNFVTPQVNRLQLGALYIDVHSASYPDGEARRQLALKNMFVGVNKLSGDQEVPPVTTTAKGIFAVTYRMGSLAPRFDLRATGVDNARSANIYLGVFASSSQPIMLLSSDGVGHWSKQQGVDFIPEFNYGTWFINVITPLYALGEIRGSVPIIPIPFMTLTELQTTVFTPRCSSCHNGVGTSLPGSMNLTAGFAYSALVGVPSVEQNKLSRVKMGTPSESYLLQKLAGVSSITGGQMPLGGPYLDTATLEKVRMWIAGGAPNN